MKSYILSLCRLSYWKTVDQFQLDHRTDISPFADQVWTESWKSNAFLHSFSKFFAFKMNEMSNQSGRWCCARSPRRYDAIDGLVQLLYTLNTRKVSGFTCRGIYSYFFDYYPSYLKIAVKFIKAQYNSTYGEKFYECYPPIHTYCNCSREL